MKDARRLREEREAFKSKRQEYSGFSRGDMLSSAQGLSAIPGSASLRRSVCHQLLLIDCTRPDACSTECSAQPAHHSMPTMYCMRTQSWQAR